MIWPSGVLDYLPFIGRHPSHSSQLHTEQPHLVGNQINLISSYNVKKMDGEKKRQCIRRLELRVDHCQVQRVNRMNSVQGDGTQEYWSHASSEKITDVRLVRVLAPGSDVTGEQVPWQIRGTVAGQIFKHYAPAIVCRMWNKSNPTDHRHTLLKAMNNQTSLSLTS